jgi:hypothetical protein
MNPTASSAASPPDRWTRTTYLYGALVAAGVGYFLLDLPVQVTDSYGNMVDASRGTLSDLVWRQFFQHAYLRPLLWAHIRVLLDFTADSYFWIFRGWHVMQVALLIALYLAIVRPRGAAAAAAVPVGLGALIGMHTFAGTIREAFPVNTFMTILLCCYAAAAVALGPRRWWRDLAAVVLFVFASLTVESGLLVWVVFVAAWIAGARGVSNWGIAGQCALLAGYFYLRFAVLGVGAPGLEERTSGFGFSSRDPEELIASFGGNPLPFYAYNVVSSVLTILFGEPRAGVWITLRNAMVEGEYVTLPSVLALACTLGSVVILRYVWRRRREWLARRFDRSDQIVFVFFGVTAANAVISYPYTKDVIMSPAGIFFAAALTVALSDLLRNVATATVPRAVLSGALVTTLAAAWAVCLVSAHLGLRYAAAQTRAEWAYVDAWLEREDVTVSEPSALEMKRRLQDEAVRAHPMRPPLRGDWIEWMQDN